MKLNIYSSQFDELSDYVSKLGNDKKTLSHIQACFKILGIDYFKTSAPIAGFSLGDEVYLLRNGKVCDEVHYVIRKLAFRGSFPQAFIVCPFTHFGFWANFDEITKNKKGE